MARASIHLLAVIMIGFINVATAVRAADAVKEGDQAPDIELPATQIAAVLPDKQDAKTLRLKDLQGKKNVVLYFFPKASTPG